MSAWDFVKGEMPDVRVTVPTTWGGFAGAALAAAAVTAARLPVQARRRDRKAADKPKGIDRKREARELFKEAYSLSLDLPTPAEFADSILVHFDLPDALQPVIFRVLRGLYADSAPDSAASASRP